MCFIDACVLLCYNGAAIDDAWNLSWMLMMVDGGEDNIFVVCFWVGIPTGQTKSWDGY